MCRNAIRNFPPGTYHLILINLFDEKCDHLLFIEHNGHYIGCADNGLITMILEEEPQKITALTLEKNQPRNILYCTGIFAKAFGKLASGIPFAEIGYPDISIKVKNPLKPMLGNNWIEGQIIFIDNFENVIVNISKEEFEEQRKGRKFSIVFKRDESIEKISETYADVPEGEKIALFNAAGYLEIAINKGNAAGLLFGLMGYREEPNNPYLQNRLFYNVVKIFFE